MTSAVEICNQALAAMGSRVTISALDEDSPAARVCSLHYASARDSVLRAAHWGFARAFKTAALQKAAPGLPGSTAEAGVWDTSTMPPPPWGFQYAYPQDCLLLRYVLPQASSSGFSIPLFSSQLASAEYMLSKPAKFAKITDIIQDVQTTCIVTNAESAIFCYTRKIENLDAWDTMAVDALTFGIASLITIPLNGDKSMREAMAKQANQNIMLARVADANEGITVNDVMPDWLQVRGISQMTEPGLSMEYGPLFEVY